MQNSMSLIGAWYVIVVSRNQKGRDNPCCAPLVVNAARLNAQPSAFTSSGTAVNRSASSP
jgi:hypothetical protein